jgi:hypothetical protein
VTETYGAKALRIALSQVGTKEDPPGSNTGRRCASTSRRRTLAAPAGRGAPASSTGRIFKRGRCSRTGLRRCRNCSAGTRTANGWCSPTRSGPGDAVIYDWQRDGTPDHIGLFRRWMTPAHTDFEAVEGNTAVGNNSNGGEVMVRLRYVKDVAAFVRPVGSRVPVGTKFDPVTGEAHRSVAARVWRLVRRRNGLVYVEPTD